MCSIKGSKKLIYRSLQNQDSDEMYRRGSGGERVKINLTIKFSKPPDLNLLLPTTLESSHFKKKSPSFIVRGVEREHHRDLKAQSHSDWLHVFCL